MNPALVKDKFAPDIREMTSCVVGAGLPPDLIVHREEGWRSRVLDWCVIGPMDKSNNHRFALQWVRGVAGGPRVRVGCKYKTLPQAWRYIKLKMKRERWQRNKYEQAECIIRWMLLRAQDSDLPGCKNVKFDASLNKRK